MKAYPILLSPDDAGGGTTGGDQGAAEGMNETPGGELFSSDQPTAPGATTVGNVTQLTTEKEGGEGAEPATEALHSPALTKEDIAELVSSIGAAVKPAQPDQTQQPHSQLSEEQLEQMFNVWKPSPEFIAQLRNESPEIALKALVQLRDGMMRQAMSMAEFRVKQLIDSVRQEITGQITPLSEYVSEARANAFRDDFFEQNPDLEPYEQLVDAVAARLYQSGGQEFLKLTRDQRMKLFADESKKLVQELLAKGGNPAASGGNGGKTGTQPGTRRMSTLTSGGQPGSRGAGGGKFSTGNKHVDDGLAALD